MRKYGKFSLDRELFDKAINNEISMYDLECILANFLIVRAELMMCTNIIEYHAYSELFDELELGSELPEYNLNLSHWKEEDIGCVRLSLVGVEKL